MKKFYVMVTQARAPDTILCALSGCLWASSFGQAEIEVGYYRNYLNAGNRGVVDEEFYIVVAYNEEQAKAHPTFYRFKDNRVTEKRYEGSTKHGQLGLVNDDSNRNGSSSLLGPKGIF